MPWLLFLLIAAIAICSWLSPPGSSLNRSAWRALDNTVALLSQAGADDDDDGIPERAPRAAAHATSVKTFAHEPRRVTPGAEQSLATTRRKRITPFTAKRVGALFSWRCAACGDLLTEDFEVDHHISLQNGGSDDIQNLRPLHKRWHLLKSSLEQRR